MKELGLNTNRISEIIKRAFEVKKVSLEPDWNFTRFLPFDAVRNMRNIVNGKEIQVSEYQLFFKNFTEFLNKEFLDKESLKKSYLGQKFKDLISENTDLTFKYEGLIEEDIIGKKENEIYLKILTLLTDSNFDDLTLLKVLQIFNTLELFLNKPDFFQAIDFSKKMDAIYYSLIHAESLEVAKMLTFLSFFDLLNGENIKKLIFNGKLDIKQFASVLNKLSLSGGTEHLLTQANLDKLLQNPEINLEALAKFIQASDESKPLTQEKFDLAINLKNLLTENNIIKIENIQSDPKILANVIFLLDKAGILTQDNFNSIINLEEIDRANLFLVIFKFSDSNILDQKQFSQFLAIYNKAKVFDNQNRISSDPKDDSSDSLIDRLCAAFLKMKVLTKNICKIIVEFFTNKINLHDKKRAEVKTDLGTETQNCNSFFQDCNKNKTENVINQEVPRANSHTHS